MNKFISLTKFQLKDFMSRYRGSMNLKGAFGNFLMLFLFIAFLPPAFQLANGLYNSLNMIGHAELALTYIYIASVLMAFLTAISFVISLFFYAKDLQFLATLPVNESAIIFSKLSTIYLYLFGIGTVFFAPSLIVYGFKSGVTLAYIIFGVIAVVIQPVIPLAIASIIVLPIMRVVSGSKRKNFFTIIASLGLLAIIIGFQVLIARQQMNPDLIGQILTQENGLMQFVGMKFPPSVWLTKMLMGSLLDAFLFLGLNVALLFAINLLAKVFYRKALLAYNQETNIVAGKLYFRQRDKQMQLIRRHVLIILKQPTFFLNTVLSLFVPLLMFAMMLFTGEFSLSILKAPALIPFSGLIFAGIISSPTIIANISVTAITREGKAFWESKVLPISTADNLRTRILTTILFNFFGSLVLGIISVIMLPLTFEQFALGVALCVTLTLFLAHADIIVNIKRPLLDWTNPTAAVKNNLNVIIALLIRVVFGFGVFFITRLFSGWSLTSIAWVLVAIFGILYIVTRHLVYHRFIHDFVQIEA